MRLVELIRVVLFSFFVFIYTFRNANPYKFMSDYEYQLGLVDVIVEASPGDEITKEYYLNGSDYLTNLTNQQKYRMCKEAIQLERFQVNNFTLLENGVPGAVKKYKSSFQISHTPGDALMNLTSLGFLCPSQPGPLCLQQGPHREIIYVNSLKTVATTPAYEFLK